MSTNSFVKARTVSFCKGVFFVICGITPFSPKASAAVSKAPMIAPPPNAAAGSSNPSPALLFISLSISPAPRKDDGRKAPNAPPTLAATAVPSAALPANAPPIANGTEATIEGMTCGIALVNNHSAASPTPSISSICIGLPYLAICASLFLTTSSP